MKNVLIFLGGTAPERDVSVITGVLTANSFDKELFNPIVVFMAGDGKLYVGKDLFNLDFYKTKDLKKCRQATLVVGDDRLFVVKGKKISPYCVADCAINCLHGGDGEGGALSGLLKSCFIPLASPDIYPSALSIDKHFTKLALKTLGVNCVDYVRVKRDGFFAPGRFVMTCCVEDIQFMGIPCKYPQSAALKARSWVTVTASVEVKYHSLYRGVGPILNAISISPAEPAEQQVATF